MTIKPLQVNATGKHKKMPRFENHKLKQNKI